MSFIRCVDVVRLGTLLLCAVAGGAGCDLGWDDVAASGMDAGKQREPDSGKPDGGMNAPRVLATAGDPCKEPGARACQGNASQITLRCNGGAWQTSDICKESQRCDSRVGSSVGMCVPIVAGCIEKAAGATFCAENSVMTCDADLVSAGAVLCDGVQETCVETGAGARCTCDASKGYEGTSGACTEIDDCSASPCANGGTCKDKGLGFACTCATGWKGDTCTDDINECTESVPAICARGTCVNELGGFRCDCSAGFTPNAAGNDCDDVDECANAANCGQASGFGACKNNIGSYECFCGPGRMGQLCEVTDQCALTNVCTVAYPCVEESVPKTYRCHGQFPEWNVNAAHNFTVGNGVVTDPLTGLEWQRDLDSNVTTLDGAKTYCNDLVRDNKGDWRLPTITELESIVDRTKVNPAIDQAAFPSTPPGWFWTSSAYGSASGGAWAVYFYDGSSGYETGSSSNRVRCVR